MATIKKSNTTRIFEKNNFGKFLPILSNENLIERLINIKSSSNDALSPNEILKKRRLPIGTGPNQIEPALISQLLQSVTTYGKFTNEILNEIKEIKDLDKAFKITYISPKEFKAISQLSDNSIPNVLSKIDINTMLYGTETTAETDKKDKINLINNLDGINENIKYPYLRNRNNPGLSVIQVLNPEFRGCFKNSQELDLFFNMISTLDMSMAIPYVNAEFLIPQKVTRNTAEVGSNTNTNSKAYLTASLNNFILGDDYFIKDENGKSNYDSVLDTAKAINGDFKVDELTTIRNSVKTSRNEQQTRIKKTYNRQFLNNAIFFAPQTMVNGDYNIDNNPNAMVDKFRPFMTINNLSFDVRPTKGLLFYKTATMELVLYDKARMSQIAPFIKPELLNTVSSEIILEYGWQSNLGDTDYGKTTVVSINGQDVQYSENPIAEFLNSLKVREKYIIVNSSYTINQNGSVNISLSLAMKGPAELRGLSFRQDIDIAKLQTNLNDFIEIIKTEATARKFQKKARSVYSVGGQVTRVEETSAEESTGFAELNTVVKDISIENLNETTLKSIENIINNTQGLNKNYTRDLLTTITEAKKSLTAYSTAKEKIIEQHFPFFNTHDSKTNDPFVDEDWWNQHLGKIKDNESAVRNATVITSPGYDSKEWISLGKLLTSIIGRRLVIEDKKYDEIQFVFYNLNGKAIQASFLNIASIPVDIKLFKNRLVKLLNSASRLSYEGILEFILNMAVNEKAAAVYGLGEYFKFSENNSSEISINTTRTAEEKKRAINVQTNAVKAAIYKQYYGGSPPQPQQDNKVKFDSEALNQLNEINKGIFDLTFNVPKVVMNFDSTYHENDANASILRISFYDNLDNPFESVTELMSNLQKNDYRTAISGITVLRAKIKNARTSIANLQKEAKATQPQKKEDNPKKPKQKKEKSADESTQNIPANTKSIEKVITNVQEAISADTSSQIYTLIKDGLIVLKDSENAIIPITDINFALPLENSKIKTIAINVKSNDKIKTFSNMKSFFKTYMPSLTFGQSNSALLSGNITTNQDAKYSTMLLMQQNGEEAEKEPTKYDFELFNQMNNAPMWVIPAQASAQIIGCPIVNFSQLIFLDFNTGTSIDNMYFINGIKHSISPGKFTTDLTLVQKDVYSQFEAEATAIASFFKAVSEWNDIKAADVSKKIEEIQNKPVSVTTNTTTDRAAPNTVTSSITRYQLNIRINHATPS
jgi:hypothetical protein